ncbi:C69 family dipeptidase [bacterium]|nr:C69 family dipeptidase [bacterium]
MNLKRTSPILFISLSALLLLGALTWVDEQKSSSSPENWEKISSDRCTSILVGKEASTDGSTITTHTADCGVCDWTWYHVPAQDHKPREMRPIYHISQIKTWPPDVGSKWEMSKQNKTGVSIPEVSHTYAYHHGVFGYMNEHQLAIGESTIGCRKKMKNNTPSGTFDITTLTLLAMERCRTAREAIQLMGNLAEKYGYGHDSGEMLAVADPQEVWMFEIMPVGPLWSPESGKPGAVWCAQRVPDDHVSVCPNESRIGEINLENKDKFMASPNVVSFAVDQGFYDPEKEDPFNWKRAYSPTSGSAASSGGTRARLWRFFDLVAPSQNFSPDTPNMEFPFSVKPDKKLSLEDVMRITRDKYQGTSFDPAKGLKGGPFSNPNYHPRPFKVGDKVYPAPRTISVSRAEYTTITQCRSWLPDPIGGLVWLAFGAQDTSCYVPLYAGITKLPDSFQIGDHWIFNKNSARWAFDYVDFHTQVAYSYAIQDVKKVRQKWEKKALEKTPSIDTTAEILFQKDSSLAVEFLTDYCINHAQEVINAWWDLGNHLLVKYNHLGVYDSKNRETRSLDYPQWWLKEVVDYHNLKPLSKEEKN